MISAAALLLLLASAVADRGLLDLDNTCAAAVSRCARAATYAMLATPWTQDL